MILAWTVIPWESHIGWLITAGCKNSQITQMAALICPQRLHQPFVNPLSSAITAVRLALLVEFPQVVIILGSLEAAPPVFMYVQHFTGISSIYILPLERNYCAPSVSIAMICNEVT